MKNSIAGLRDWTKATKPALGLLRNAPVLFWNPENGSADDSQVWWRIPVSLRPYFGNWKRVDECCVYLVILQSGSVREEHQMCWQTSEGPQRVIHLESNTIYSVPVAVRTLQEKNEPVVADAVRGIRLSVPSHFPVITDADVILNGKAPEASLSNKDHVLQLEVRRQGDTIKKSKLYVLHVPPHNQDNRYFVLHLRSVPAFKLPSYRPRVELAQT